MHAGAACQSGWIHWRLRRTGHPSGRHESCSIGRSGRSLGRSAGSTWTRRHPAAQSCRRRL